ncbi:MAG: AraC family transcriptional regulator, partial [Ruminococcus flavefaciens]
PARRSSWPVSIVFPYLYYITFCNALQLCGVALRETNLTVTAIAEKCGYSSYIHFTKQFRKAENTTPTNYRMKNRADVDI